MALDCSRLSLTIRGGARWALAQIPRNGTPLLTTSYDVRLRADASEADVAYCFQQLQKQYAPRVLDPELKQLARGSPALMCHYVQEAASSYNSDLLEVVKFSNAKWLEEVRA